MNRKQIDRRTLLLGAATLTAGGIARKHAEADELAPLRSLWAGQAYLKPTDLVLTGTDGHQIPLAGLRGKPFLLHIWATWCPPCREELPHLDAFRAAHPDLPVVPAAIGSGAPEKVAAFLSTASLDHVGALTVDKAPFKAWLGAREVGIPATYLIDGNGLLRASRNGGLDWAAPDAADTVRADLASAAG